MLNLNLNILGRLNSGGGSNNSYVQAWLNKLAVLGYTPPSDTYITKLNTAFHYAVLNGLISLLDCFYCFNNNGSMEAGLVNMVDPNSLALTAYNSPTWTSGSKIKFNGTTQYLENSTLLSAYSKFSRNSASMGCHVVDGGTGNGIVMGNYKTGNYSQINTRSDHYLMNNSSVGSPNVVSSDVGHFMVCRESSNDFSIHLNGVEEFGLTNTSAAVNDHPVGIGRRSGASPVVYWNGSLSCAYIGSNLEPKKVEMNNFINMLL